MKEIKTQYKVRYTFATSRRIMTKSGKAKVNRGAAFFEVNGGRGWIALANVHERLALSAIPEEVELSKVFAPYARKTFSRGEVALARYNLCNALADLGLFAGVISEEMKASAEEARQRLDERAKDKEKRERDIIANGREAYVDKGAASYGARFDRLSDVYGTGK